MDRTEARITLAIDAMGSDQGPHEVLAGVSLALEVAQRNSDFLLFCKEDLLTPIMDEYPNLMGGQVTPCTMLLRWWKWMKNPLPESKERENLPCPLPWSL